MTVFSSMEHTTDATITYTRMDACPRCVKQLWLCDYTDGQCTCDYRENYNPSVPNLGWRCPGCQRVFAPSVEECKYCNGGTDDKDILSDLSHGDLSLGGADSG